jgi:hypothetical protein
MTKRTLYSKYSMAVAGVASRDARDVALHRVHFDADGSAVASNGRAVLAVSPPSAVKAATFPDVEPDNAEPPEGGVGLSLEDVAAVRRNFPAEKRPSLQFAQMTRCDERTVELMTTDGRTHKKVAGQPARGKFPRWRAVLASAKGKATRARICVDRQSLVQILNAIDKACPDAGGYNPVFLEIGAPEDAVVLRSVNLESGQTALGIVTPLLVVDWLAESKWEQGIAAEGRPRVVRKVGG